MNGNIQYSWGRLRHMWSHTISFPSDSDSLEDYIKKNDFLIAGAGRSYGDIGLRPGGEVIKLKPNDEKILFDTTNGIIEVCATTPLQEIQKKVIPDGWILPVSPGTSLITVGGAIANDVHGKNHFSKGAFGNHILELLLLRSDGAKYICSQKQNTDWFNATIGGLGLTGVILSAKIQLSRCASPWMRAYMHRFETIEEWFDLAKSTVGLNEYSVAWLDCLSDRGRGFLTVGNILKSDESATLFDKTFNWTCPTYFSLVNKITLPILNSLYFNSKKYTSQAKNVQIDKFLYPLDSILNWNQMYGRQGFYQYQCRFPLQDADVICKEIINLVKSHESGSFLVVLKIFGNIESRGLMSFPQEGVTLAIDFPNTGQKVRKLASKLDQLIKAVGGSVYLAKDALLTKESFEVFYPNLEQFLSFHDKNISSGLFERLMKK